MSINDARRQQANRASLELSGVDDAQSWRPLDAALIPKDLSVDDEYLRYDDSSYHRERTWPRDLLTSFVALRNGSPKDILSFAKRAGVMALCSHGLPSTHVLLDGHYGCCIRAEPNGRERLSGWRWLAADAQAILTAAAALKAGRRVAMADWDTLIEPPRPPELDYSQEADCLRRDIDPRRLLSSGDDWEPEWVRQTEWDRLVPIVNQWIGWGAVHPFVHFQHHWPPREREVRGRLVSRDGLKRPRLELSGGLFGALALQLAAFVTGTRGIEQCSCCGEFFAPEIGRVARRGPGRYCPNCQGTNEAARLASKALRARKARVRTLRDQGWTIEAIANDLGRPKAIIRKWVKE